ncbi:MAG: response regulator transcription factor [Ignavibacteria bacterium]|nr:response regulator transcription factor [Ignavibacteria bacterium]
MLKAQCLIVDDEPLAIDVIVNHLGNFSGLAVAGTCSNAVEAFEMIKKHRIDLVFLDIQMPEINGISFVKSLKKPPAIIFTTAYRDFAIEGFDLNAIDYLLKPISLERFIQAIDKYYASAAGPADLPTEIPVAPAAQRASIFVKTERKMMRVFLDEIYLIESLKEYVIIYKKDKKVITKVPISHFENILPANQFMRIHRSYIVAVQKVEAYTQTSIEILNKELPLGRNYKLEILNRLAR